MQVSLSEKTQNVRRLEAQRNELNAKVRLLREELQLLQEQGSHVGEVIKPMDKKKVLVKVKGRREENEIFVYLPPKKFERLHVSYFDRIWLKFSYRIAGNIGVN